MSRKNAEATSGSSGSKNGAKPGNVPAPQRPPEDLFGEKRSGRDRREEQAPVVDPRREATSERRRAALKQATWWLERDYVESHHFVQKASASRTRGKKVEDDKSS